TPGRRVHLQELLQLADARRLTTPLEQRQFGLEAADGVALGHRDEIHLVASLWYANLHALVDSSAEEVLPHAQVKFGLRHQYQTGDLHRSAVVIGHERFENLDVVGAVGVQQEA